MFALGATCVAPLGKHLSQEPPEVSAAELKEAEELDVSYVRSKGTSVLFGPLVKCAFTAWRKPMPTSKSTHMSVRRWRILALLHTWLGTPW